MAESATIGGLLLALHLGCSPGGVTERPGPSSPPAEWTKAQRVEAFVRGGWGFELGGSREAVIANLGRPERTEVEPVPNRHVPGATDTIYTMTYGALRVELHHATPVQKELLANLEITGPGYDVRWGLEVGAPISRVREVLGEPDAYRQNVYIYATDDPTTNRVLFHFAGGVVRKLEWQFYVD